MWGGPGPSVRGANRELQIRDSHRIPRRTFTSHGRDEKSLDAFALVWRLPDEEYTTVISEEISVNGQWNISYSVYACGILMTRNSTKSDWPLHVGDLIVAVGDSDATRLPNDDDDSSNMVNQLLESAGLGNRRVVLRYRRELERSSFADQTLWWCKLPELPLVSSDPIASVEFVRVDDDGKQQTNPNFAKICDEWFSNFADVLAPAPASAPVQREGDQRRLSWAGARAFLNSFWLRFHSLYDPLPQRWQSRFGAQMDSLLTRDEFCETCGEIASALPGSMKAMLRACGKNSATLEPSTYASSYGQKLCSASFEAMLTSLARYPSLCDKGDDVSPALLAIFHGHNMHRIVAFLGRNTSEFLVFTIGLQDFANPERLMDAIALVGCGADNSGRVNGGGTVLDVRCGHTDKPNFKPKKLQEACENRCVRYVAFGIDGAPRSFGNAATVRGLDPPVVVVDNRAELAGSHRLEVATRLVHHGIADVVHLKLLGKLSPAGGSVTSKLQLAYALHPGSFSLPCEMPSSKSAQRVSSVEEGPMP